MSPIYRDENGKWWYCRDGALDGGPFDTEQEAWKAYDAYCQEAEPQT